MGFPLPLGAPLGAMFDNPVKKRLLETDIVARLFALNPLMPEDFLPLGKELLIEERLLNEVCGFFGGIAHSSTHGISIMRRESSTDHSASLMVVRRKLGGSEANPA